MLKFAVILWMTAYPRITKVEKTAICIYVNTLSAGLGFSPVTDANSLQARVMYIYITQGQQSLLLSKPGTSMEKDMVYFRWSVSSEPAQWFQTAKRYSVFGILPREFFSRTD